MQKRKNFIQNKKILKLFEMYKYVINIQHNHMKKRNLFPIMLIFVNESESGLACSQILLVQLTKGILSQKDYRKYFSTQEATVRIRIIREIVRDLRSKY